MTQYVTKQEFDNGLDRTKKEIIESIQEVLEAMQTYATHVDERFEAMDERLERIEATMVTKDYFEKKLVDLGGYLGSAIQAIDKKITLSTRFLHRKNIFNNEEIQEILTIETSPRNE